MINKLGHKISEGGVYTSILHNRTDLWVCKGVFGGKAEMKQRGKNGKAAWMNPDNLIPQNKRQSDIKE